MPVSHTRLRSNTAVGGKPLKKSGFMVSPRLAGPVRYRKPSMNGRGWPGPEISCGPFDSASVTCDHAASPPGSPRV